jgi:transposase
LRLNVNAAKSAVDRPWNRRFLGFTFTCRRDNRRKESDKALKSFKTRIREIPRRPRGRTLVGIIEEGTAAYSKSEEEVFLGLVEGLNNKIRVIKRRAYGLRDQKCRRLKVFTCILPAF